MDGAGEGHIESFLRRSGRDVEDRYVPGFGLAGELRLRVGCGDDRGDGFAGGNPEDLGTAECAGYVILIRSQGDFRDQVSAVSAAYDEVGFGEVVTFVPGDESCPDCGGQSVVDFLSVLPGLREGDLGAFNAQEGGADQDAVYCPFLVLISLDVVQPSLDAVHPVFEGANSSYDVVHPSAAPHLDYGAWCGGTSSGE